MTDNLPARTPTAGLQSAYSREIARVDAATAQGVHRIRAQVNKEIAAVQVLAGVGGAADRLPADLPDRQRRMALRAAITTSRLIGRLTR